MEEILTRTTAELSNDPKYMLPVLSIARPSLALDMTMIRSQKKKKKNSTYHSFDPNVTIASSSSSSLCVSFNNTSVEIA